MSHEFSRHMNGLFGSPSGNSSHSQQLGSVGTGPIPTGPRATWLRHCSRTRRLAPWTRICTPIASSSTRPMTTPRNGGRRSRITRCCATRKYVENVYYQELARELRGWGYRIRNRPRGDFEVAGISDELRERFSKRHQQIDAALAELLKIKPELSADNFKDLRERLATAERSRKTRDFGRTELRRLWQEQMTHDERENLGRLMNRSDSRPAEAPGEGVKE